MEKKKSEKEKSQKKQGRCAAEVRSFCAVLKDKYGKQGPPQTGWAGKGNSLPAQGTHNTK
jgi:hypothetical protein